MPSSDKRGDIATPLSSSGCPAQWQPSFKDAALTTVAMPVFFHQCGRRMVPRSSLKEGKYSQMVEKGQRQPNNKPNKTKYSPQAQTPQKKSMAARVCAPAKSQKSSNGLHITVTSDQQPLHRAAKTWSQCKSRALVCSIAGLILA